MVLGEKGHRGKDNKNKKTETVHHKELERIRSITIALSEFSGLTRTVITSLFALCFFAFLFCFFFSVLATLFQFPRSSLFQV